MTQKALLGKSVKDSRTSVSVIGAGRLGTALALAMKQSGYVIVAVVCRTSASARKAAKKLGGARSLTSKQLGLLPLADIILMATPDDALATTAAQLAAIHAPLAKSTVLHTSGALSSEMLKPLRDVGFHTGSLHPLTSISRTDTGAKLLKRAFFCVEGDSQAVKVARRIVTRLGGRSFSIASKSKPLYHAAAVMSSGHLIALLDLAGEMLGRCGLSRTRSQEVLMPLVLSTVENLQNSNPAKALTGTFARGDIATLKAHLQSMSSEELKLARVVYLLLAMRSLGLAKDRLEPNLLKRMEQLITRETSLLLAQIHGEK